jgi:hypothetical protein
MASKLLPLSSDGTWRFPVATDFELYAVTDTVTIAVNVEAQDGMPTVVFVPLAKECIPNLVVALGAAGGLVEPPS